MPATTPAKLDEIYARVWHCLVTAAHDSQHPLNAMQAATVGLDGAPNVRTVALRRASEARNVVTFHTDWRSPKVAELTREPRIALVGIDAARELQIRLFGKAHIVREGAERLDAWNASSDDRELIQYRTLLAPGTPVGQPGDVFGETGDVPGPREGLKHFCVVQVVPFCIDWLDLSAADNPERARFVRNGDAWDRSWVAP